jgi:carboxyl-terminal processing protease
MKRQLIYGLVAAALALNLAIGAAIYLQSARAAEPKDSMDANLELFADVLQKVRAEYVDGTNLSYRNLTYAAIRGLIGSLDPHSEFLDSQDYKQLQDDTEGQFGGLGMVVSMRDGYVTVVAPMEDTPAFRAGILSGDRIIKVNGKSVERLPLDAVVNRLRGEPGTPVTMTIQRPASGEQKTLTFTRAIIQMDMVKDINSRQEFPLGADGIGYIRITEFGDRTADELQAALDKLQAQGMKALILDLRMNPGGLLGQAVDVCQKFLPRGQLIVSTEGGDPAQNSVLRARGHGDELRGMPMVVLVDFGTASASEIVTGCLHDLHRAVVLGGRTFGKGLVETIFPFDNGTALKLTVARYYTPSHRVIEARGIEPDIVVPMTQEQEAVLLLTRSPGGLEALGPTNRVRIANIQDVQLDRAEDLLKGLLLYGQLENQPMKMAVKQDDAARN